MLYLNENILFDRLMPYYNLKKRTIWTDPNFVVKGHLRVQILRAWTVLVKIAGADIMAKIAKTPHKFLNNSKFLIGWCWCTRCFGLFNSFEMRF